MWVELFGGLEFFAAVNAYYVDRTECPGWHEVAWVPWGCLLVPGSTQRHWVSEQQLEKL